MKNALLLSLISFFGQGLSNAQLQKISFHKGWNFSLSGINKKADQVVLPYHWNNGTYTTHEYCRGQAIYQKEFHLSSDDEMIEHFLFFEGVNSKATVILNGKMLRMCAGSYNDLSSNPYEKIDIWQNGTFLESGLPPVEIVDGQHRLTMPYVVDVDTNRIEQQFAGKELPFSMD